MTPLKKLVIALVFACIAFFSTERLQAFDYYDSCQYREYMCEELWGGYWHDQWQNLCYWPNTPESWNGWVSIYCEPLYGNVTEVVCCSDMGLCNQNPGSQPTAGMCGA